MNVITCPAWRRRKSMISSSPSWRRHWYDPVEYGMHPADILVAGFVVVFGLAAVVLYAISGE